jgi:glycosyltransferase involved in cell wall biosynthesis
VNATVLESASQSGTRVTLPRIARRPHRVIVVLEQRFEQTPDGNIWGPGSFSREFWQRYLDVFDAVRVLARIRGVPRALHRFERCDAEGIEFCPIPYYVGPLQFVQRRRRISAAIVGALDPNCSVIARIPSPVGSLLIRRLKKIGKPYAVEVIGDPYDVLSPEAFKHRLRPLLRWWLSRQQRAACLGAVGAAYVTERTLQRRYPCRGYSVGVSDVRLTPLENGLERAFTAQFSSVALTEYVKTSRPCAPGSLSRVLLVSVATLSQLYKGLDVLIDAVRVCAAEGLDVHLTIVGEGKFRGELEARATRAGVASRVRFAGFLSRAEVTTELDTADIFVLPSRCEGLPRALIEAMARGLPCIASNVGGIPELLESDELVPPGSAAVLAKAIIDVARDPERRSAMSTRNLARAQEFRDDVLRVRRTEFYRQVRAATERWVVQS